MAAGRQGAAEGSAGGRRGRARPCGGRCAPDPVLELPGGPPAALPSGARVASLRELPASDSLLAPARAPSCSATFFYIKKATILSLIFNHV